jgi:hypothetical protein
MKAPVLDRVKADINVDKKRDRCVELPWPVTQDDTSAWTELVAKLKEGIIFSFDSYVTMRQEDIQKSESQRTMPGWNFCTYFILKVWFSHFHDDYQTKSVQESLAMSFEGMGLMEESLQQYMELERSFFQALEGGYDNTDDIELCTHNPLFREEPSLVWQLRGHDSWR